MIRRFWQACTSRRVDSNETTTVLVTSSFQDQVTNYKETICTIRVPTTTKLGRMVTYLDGLLPIKSHDPFITRPYKIKRD